ncbi:omptin family outer membrane protease [Thermodesulfobacteriota bacterium B35]
MNSLERRKKMTLVAALVLAGSGMVSLPRPDMVMAAPAANVEGSTTLNIHHPIVVSGRLGMGYLTGESYENVYDPDSGRKISQLNWDLSDVYMVGGGVSIQPLSWVKLNMDLWLKVTDGDGDMVDYDWFVEGLDWTHRSYTTDVDLDTGYMYDINVEFPVFRLEDTEFSLFAGYKYDKWKWVATGGTFIYSTYYLRDTIGTLPDETGITYEQWYHVPYVGIGFHAELTRVTLSGRLIASPFVQAGDRDQHHLRNLVFEEDFDNGTMLGVDLNGGYRFTDQLALMFNYHYQKYEEMKGDTTITDQVTGEQYHIPGDAASIEHYSHLFSLSLQYTF